MNENAFVSGTSVLSLPIECKQEILSFITDVPTLQAAILSHRTFYYAFRDRSSFIIERVLRSVVPHESFLEAIIAFEFRRRKPDSWLVAAAYVDFLRDDEIPPTFEFTIQNAIAIQQLHDAVLFFANDFAYALLYLNGAVLLENAKLPCHCCRRPIPQLSFPMSISELHRIIRFFYRYELCSSLVPKGQRWLQETLSKNPEFEKDGLFYMGDADLIYMTYDAVEIAQVAAVCDYLLEKMSGPFDEIAAHNREWKALKQTIHDEDGQNKLYAYKEHAISCGLRFLHQAIRAETYDEKYKILNSRFDEATNYFHATLSFLHDDLRELEFPDLEYMYYAEMDPPGVPRVYRTDSGRVKAFKEAHSDRCLRPFLHDGPSCSLKFLLAGYVVWDDPWSPRKFFVVVAGHQWFLLDDTTHTLILK